MKKNTLMVYVMLAMPIQCFAEDGTIEQLKEAEKFTSDKCYAYLLAMPDLLPIANKISLPDIKKATFDQLANTDKAIDQEKPLIAKYAEGAKICDELSMAENKEFSGTVRYIKDILNVRTSLLIDLYNQKISYGEYVKLRKDKNEVLETEYKAAKAENESQMAANDANLKAQEESQRHQWWSNLFQGLSDGVSNSRPPRAINCNPNGLGGVRCQ